VESPSRGYFKGGGSADPQKDGMALPDLRLLNQQKQALFQLVKLVGFDPAEFVIEDVD
jgi:Spy/CpxP family protein refolding chaperone